MTVPPVIRCHHSLILTGPAGVNAMSKSTQSSEGDSLTFACDSYGYPAAQFVTWYKDSVEISPNPAIKRCARTLCILYCSMKQYLYIHINAQNQ